jgi:thiamine-monophosphate kinase
MPPDNKLATLGEFGLISRITAAVGPAKGVITGIGDDAAVTALSPGMQLLTSTDMLLEDVHFRLAWHDPYRLGRKSLAVSISDIAAMGAIPRWALLSLALPRECSLDLIDEFTRGFLAMADEQGVALIGGDTCASKSGLVISVTIMAEQVPGLIARRSGARPGDDIWVTGTLGDAALGLKLLEEDSDPLAGSLNEVEPYLLSRLLDPRPRTEAGRLLAESGLVSAMIDLSDGLLADFGHIAELSGVGGTLQIGHLPTSLAFRTAAARLAEFPHQLALCGGEDYELAFTAAPENRKKIIGIMKKSSLEAVRVGIVTSSPKVEVILPDGSNFKMQSTGFTHFS